MAVLVAGVLLLCCYSASSYPFQSQGQIPSGDPVREWKALARVLAKERALMWSPRAGSQTPTGALPSFFKVSYSDNNQVLFRPEIGARPVLNAVRGILRATPQPVTTEPPRSSLFESLCHLDRIYVRVKRILFNTKTAYQRLTLGSCPVNRASNEHFYFLYLLSSPCGFSNESLSDVFAVNNVLHFDAVADPQQKVVWEVAFDVSVQCQYHRIHHVFSTGIHPKLNSGTIFRQLTSTTSGTIILQDAAGNELTGAQPYTLGQPMYFEAKLMGAQSADQRLYVNKCYMTASQDSSSTTEHIVIDKQGCMQDSQITIQAQFIKQDSKMSLRFSIGAFMFKGMMGTPGTPKRINMHCEIALGPLIATESAKSCTYDSTDQKWIELHDDDNAVCTCCDSFCVAPPRASKVMLTSSSLEVEYSHALDLLNLPSGNLDQSEDDYWKSR